MKKSLYILLLLLSWMLSSAQQDSTFFFEEFNISINHVTLKNNTKNNVGWGVGANHIFIPDKKVNILFGVEFNKTTQFFSSLYMSHFSNFTDVTFNIYSISIPVAARFNFGHKTKFLIETGGYLDLNLCARQKGKMTTYLPGEGIKVSDIDEKTGVASLNYGVSVGLGVSIPISKFRMIIKTEYKFGFANISSSSDYIGNSYIRLVAGFKLF